MQTKVKTLNIATNKSISWLYTYISHERKTKLKQNIIIMLLIVVFYCEF